VVIQLTLVLEIYDTALAASLGTNPDQVVPVVTARAGFEKRRFESTGGKVKWSQGILISS
jgi:hypothetical protein